MPGTGESREHPTVHALHYGESRAGSRTNSERGSGMWSIRGVASDIIGKGLESCPLWNALIYLQTLMKNHK